jgi:predicted nucleic acid-binding Zn ribbon protein
VAVFEPLARAVPPAMTALLRSTPMSPGKLEFTWKTAVGPAMGRGTSVRLEGKTLLVDARTAAWATEVARSSAIILRRLQTLLGPDVIRELTVRA